MAKVVWNTDQMHQLVGEDDVAKILLKTRGVAGKDQEQFIKPNYPADLDSGLDLPDSDKAVDRILRAIDGAEAIVIYGDYDIDGLSATALLYDFFTSAGARVGTFIPDRFEQGYGLNSNALLKLQEEGADLIITVDCGSTAVKPLLDAQKAKLDIIVTDHHTMPPKLPKGALAIVNPKRPDSTMAFTELAGVGVAFLLVRAILQKRPELLSADQEKWLLDLVALGTVCDVVPLVGANRLLAYYGLKVLQKTRRVGIKALCKAAGVDVANLNEADLGFRLGPRLNAAGRLEHAQKALELLLTDNAERATDLAMELDELNFERQTMTQTIFEEADSAAKAYKKDPILVLSSPDWSHGVVGIVASKIAEKWHKPTILMQQLEGKTKGSGRSFNTFNIIEAVSSCESILQSFGGHAFAAGVTIDTDRVEEFRYRLNQYAIANMDAKNNFKTIRVDAHYGTNPPKLQVLDGIGALAPFGNGNPEPLFAGTYKVVSMRFVGKHQNHLQVSLRSADNTQLKAIAFSALNKWPWLNDGDEAEFAFRLQENVWQDVTSLQLEIVDARPIE